MLHVAGLSFFFRQPFSVVLACASCCSIEKSMSLRLPVMTSVSTVHSGSLMQTSCMLECEGSRCTHVLMPCVMAFEKRVHCCPARAISGTFSCTAGQTAPPWHRPLFSRVLHRHVSLSEKILRLPIILYVASEPWSLPPSSSGKGLLPSRKFVVSLSVVKKVSASPVGNGKALYRVTSSGAGPCLNGKILLPFLHSYIYI